MTAFAMAAALAVSAFAMALSMSAFAVSALARCRAVTGVLVAVFPLEVRATFAATAGAAIAAASIAFRTCGGLGRPGGRVPSTSFGGAFGVAALGTGLGSPRRGFGGRRLDDLPVAPLASARRLTGVAADAFTFAARRPVALG